MAVELASGYVSIVPSARGFGAALSSAVDGEVGGAGQRAGQSFVSRMTGSFGGIATALTGAFAVREVGAFFSSAVDAARESARVAAQTAQVIESTGGAAGISATQVGDYANRLASLTGVDDEIIQQGENVLLTFTNIRNGVGEGNDVFDRAAGLALDMSQALGTDLQSAMIQVGKATNDPITGISALQRVGVSFTEQQKDQIEALVESGDTLSAQRIVLDELAREFGGTAEAVATPMDRLKVTLGNFQEQIGGALIPVIDRLAGAAVELLDAFSSRGLAGVFDVLRQKFEALSGPARAILVTVAALAAAIGIAGLAGSVAALVNPVTLVVAAIVALGAGFVYAYEHSETFRDVVTSVVEAVQAVIEVFVAVVSDLWGRFGDDIVQFARDAWEAIKQVIQGALEIVEGIFDLAKAILTGKWGEAWDAIKEILSGAWDFIKGVVSLAIAEVKALIEVGLGLITAAWDLAWNGVKTLLSDIWGLIVDVVSTGVSTVVDFFTALPGRILDALVALPGLLVDLGAALIQGLFDGVTFVWSTVAHWLVRLPITIAEAVGDLGRALFNAGKKLIQGLIDGIIAALPALDDAIDAVLDRLHGPGLFGVHIEDVFGHNAKGTNFWQGGMTWVGENGPELVNLPRGAAVFSNAQSMGLVDGVAGELSAQTTLLAQIEANTRADWTSGTSRQSLRAG